MNPFDKWNNQEDLVDVNQWLQHQQATRQKPKQDKKKKDFWTDQISTAGGILGGIGGSFIAPIAGTVGGSAAGSALGEAIENALMGEDLSKNVIQEGVLGGIFAAPPIKLAKAAIGAGKGAASAAKGTASQAAKATAEQPLKTSTQGRIRDFGNQALASQYGTISKPVARSTRPLETIDTLASYGVTKPVDAERIAGQITGSDGIVNRAVLDAVSGSGRVNTKDLRRVFEDQLELNGVVDKDKVSARAIFDAQMKKIQGGPRGSLNPDADPNDVFEVMKNLEKRAMNLLGRGDNYRNSTPERTDQANALLSLRDELEDRLWGAGANDNLPKVLTPQLRQNLLDLQPGNPKWAGFVDDKIMNARDVGELRSATAPFVRANKIIDEADVNAMTFGGRMGNDSASGPLGMVTNAVTNALKAPAARIAGSQLREVGQGGASAARPVSRAGIAARVGAAGAVGGLMDQATQLQDAAPSSLEDALYSATAAPQTFESQMPASPYSQENLLADIQRDPQNYDKYLGFYQQMQEVFAPAEDGELTSGQQEDAVRAQNALNDINSIRESVESGEIQKTLLPGSDTAIVGNVLGTTGIEAALYNVGDVILRSRTGATAPPEEVKKFVSGFLPRGGESKEAQLSKLQRAYRELQGMLNPPAALGTGPARLDEAILAAQR